MSNIFTGKYKWPVLSLLVILSMVLAACGGGASPTETEATEMPSGLQTKVPSTVPADYTLNSGGVTYTVEGAQSASGEVMKNDIIRFRINGELVQGYVRYPLSIYQGQPWGGETKFDGINRNLEVTFTTVCKGAENVDLTTSADVVITCENEEKDWQLIIRFRVSVLSTTSIQPAAPQVNAIEWKNLEENEWYLFCIPPGSWEKVKYMVESSYNETLTYDTCVVGKLLNKLAYRVLIHNDQYPQQPNWVVATMFPANVPGAYPFIQAQDLLVGRTYYVCSQGDPLVYRYEDNPEETTETCIEAVYMGDEDNVYTFNKGQNFTVENLAGAFPSPRP